MRVLKGTSSTQAHQTALANTVGGLKVDPNYPPVPMGPANTPAGLAAAANHDLYIVRGTIDEGQLTALEAHRQDAGSKQDADRRQSSAPTIASSGTGRAVSDPSV
jgi:hypothetical protein